MAYSHGWELDSNTDTSRCCVYTRNKSTGERTYATTNAYTLKNSSDITTYDYGIHYHNAPSDGGIGQDIVLSQISIKTCSCNSGGSTYYVRGTSYSASTATGKAMTHKLYVIISSTTTGGEIFEYTPTSLSVPVTEYNMNYPGHVSGDFSTGAFGYTPYEGDTGMNFRTFTYNKSGKLPVIKPGEHAWIFLSTTVSNNAVEMLLNADDMEIVAHHPAKPYVWVYQSGQWVEAKPYRFKNSKGWRDPEGRMN